MPEIGRRPTKQQHPKLLMKKDDALSTLLFLCHLISSGTCRPTGTGRVQRFPQLTLALTRVMLPLTALL
jgi:hypothetical protein